MMDVNLTSISQVDNELANPICPYLGLSGDPGTCYSFVSDRNYCHKNRPGQAASVQKQESFCLSASHTACPIFCGEVKVDARPKLISRPVQAPRILPEPAVQTHKRGLKPFSERPSDWVRISLIFVITMVLATAVILGILSSLLPTPDHGTPTSSSSVRLEMDQQWLEANFNHQTVVLPSGTIIKL